MDHGAACRVSDTPAGAGRPARGGIPAAQPSVDRVVADLESAGYGTGPLVDPGPPGGPCEDPGRGSGHRASAGSGCRAAWWPPSLFGGSRH
ncbi:hypothetical protein QJS66_08170 [Kocuria rhizophila]|nr:hypothetical protein QJS66_08170 [Kocuria rhizophila]